MESKAKKILVVDDDKDIVELLEYNLTKEGYEVKTAENGEIAVKIAKTFVPDLVLLDIMMPVLDGVEACRQLKQMPELKDTFVLMLTARAEEYSEVAAFQMGADDYVLKPIKPRALLSRLSSIFRRNNNNYEKDEIIFRDLKINKTTYTVYKGDKEINFPKKEFELLYFLSTHPNKVYGRDELLNNIWGTDVLVVPRTVDVHIRKIREKIGEDYIKTIKGIGYSLND